VIPGTTEQARTLAIQRWAALHPFDLEPSMWDELFQTYHCADILQAITRTKETRSQKPDIVYSRFQFLLEHLTSQRHSAA
jgi:hypothetical protein